MYWRKIIIFFLNLNTLVAFTPDLYRHQFQLGPKWSHVERLREGGIRQEGELFGLEFRYERLRRFGWYIGADISFLAGQIKGHLEDVSMRSDFSDTRLEGRFGYTLQQKWGWQCSFTPFIGGGFGFERNYFKEPTTFHFKTEFPFGCAGGIFWIHPMDCLDVGLYLKASLPDAKCKVCNDPDNAPLTQKTGNRPFYSVELPISYRFNCSGSMSLMLKPFFEWRHFGRQTNYPFDYKDTRFTFYGLMVAYQHRF